MGDMPTLLPPMGLFCAAVLQVGRPAAAAAVAIPATPTATAAPPSPTPPFRGIAPAGALRTLDHPSGRLKGVFTPPISAYDGHCRSVVPVAGASRAGEKVADSSPLIGSSTDSGNDKQVAKFVLGPVIDLAFVDFAAFTDRSVWNVVDGSNPQDAGAGLCRLPLCPGLCYASCMFL